tara:strand:- start:1018 stop:1272 length:255 start_codon:yes stop_codon:yes gene_type:complete
MKFDREAMIADFLAEMAELNKPIEKPSRDSIEAAFFKLLQVNVDKGFYDQDYCNRLFGGVSDMSDEALSYLYDKMKNLFPNLEV